MNPPAATRDRFSAFRSPALSEGTDESAPETGVSMNVQPMYLGESAPKELRGTVAMTSAIFTALGIVMGQVVGLRELLGGPQAWPLLLASCLVPGLLQLASLPLLPESPRYLLIDRGDAEACLAET
ncbi:hypothetical protein HJG60_008892 [Phyllostomus discolor]|uniref:Major facilitator superfamily (MFS) profile domain-containing protein n=1 Tax=Phyllostomus discolor TaxID=89673 RepID=A0A833YMG6_9CHIR|nr:hypothetical protein HJG60_008892 [Phyllostomus discolor]